MPIGTGSGVHAALTKMFEELPKPELIKGGRRKKPKATRSVRRMLKQFLGQCDWAMQCVKSPHLAKRRVRAKEMLRELSYTQVMKGMALGIAGGWYIQDRLREESISRRIIKATPIRGVPAHAVMVDDKANFGGDHEPT